MTRFQGSADGPRSSNEWGARPPQDDLPVPTVEAIRQAYANAAARRRRSIASGRRARRDIEGTTTTP